MPGVGEGPIYLMGKLEEETGRVQSHTFLASGIFVSREHMVPTPSCHKSRAFVDKGNLWLSCLACGRVDKFIWGTVLATLLGCKSNPHSSKNFISCDTNV